jgi:hypothetical protein
MNRTSFSFIHSCKRSSNGNGSSHSHRHSSSTGRSTALGGSVRAW